MSKFCPIMTAGALSNSNTIALQSENKPNHKALIDCSSECALWDQKEQRCGLIVQPPPKPNFGPG
jgi:hypothetical protein